MTVENTGGAIATIAVLVPTAAIPFSIRDARVTANGTPSPGLPIPSFPCRYAVLSRGGTVVDRSSLSAANGATTIALAAAGSAASSVTIRDSQLEAPWTALLNRGVPVEVRQSELTATADAVATLAGTTDVVGTEITGPVFSGAPGATRCFGDYNSSAAAVTC